VAPDPAPSVSPADRLVEIATRVVDLLGARVAGAPVAAPTIPRDDLVAALVALVSPTGQLAVTGLNAAADLPVLTADPRLDVEWLPVIAAVREPLARVEAHQLAAGTVVAAGGAFTGRSTKPGDPWQTDATDGRRMVVAYTGPGWDPADPVAAVTVIDRFSEVIPAEDQTTAATFGFDAPAAKAPQAILLAVPPDPAAALDDRTVLDIVAGARQLAQARVARPADLDPGLRGLLPAALLPATGTTAVPL
jgi:hypothetical protein